MASQKLSKYLEINGTSYQSENHNKKVTSILEEVRQDNTRIVLDYGDVKTGQSWGECFDIVGRIGRSNGSVKIPILLYNKRSMGGGAILDNCIVKIMTSKGKRILYQHPNYTEMK